MFYLYENISLFSIDLPSLILNNNDKGLIFAMLSTVSGRKTLRNDQKQRAQTVIKNEKGFIKVFIQKIFFFYHISKVNLSSFSKISEFESFGLSLKNISTIRFCAACMSGSDSGNIPEYNCFCETNSAVRDDNLLRFFSFFFFSLFISFSRFLIFKMFFLNNEPVK